MKDEFRIEQEILAYLAANPGAQDTLRGIVEWWILKQKIKESTSDVEAALANLVAKGNVSAQAGPDGQIYYRNQRRVANERKKTS